MTDLEMIKRCAEKMNLYYGKEADQFTFDEWMQLKEYDPLNDDAQAMALVKKFELICDPQYGTEWRVWCHSARTKNMDYVPPAFNKDLNRAIVECVARMP